MKPADAPLNNRASLFKQTEPPLQAVARFIAHAGKNCFARSGATKAPFLNK